MYSNHQPSPKHIERLQSRGTDLTVVVADSEERAIKEAPSSDVFFGHRYLRQSIPHAKRLRWVQSSGAGIDHILCPELLSRPILLTRTPVFGPIIARHAHTLAWALIRGLPDFCNLQAQQIWNPDLKTLPFPKTAMILGLGSIGRELGKLLRGDGLWVWGVKRNCDETSMAFCDDLLDSTSWQKLLPDVDLCFLILPLNLQTKGIFDERCLRALPPHGVLINVGRGGTLDTQALIRVLRDGHLGGVGLDVVDPQPPAPGDPIWRTPRLLLTPYVAGRYPGRPQILEDFFERQLDRYLAGEPLEGLINPLDLMVP